MKTIAFTTASNEAVFQKLNIYKELVNSTKNVDLQKYTDKLEALGIIFQCFPKDDPVRKVKEYKIMRRKTPKLELYLVLDYDKILHGTDEANLQYIKSVFKKGCEKYLKPMKGFDWKEFEKEVLGKL